MLIASTDLGNGVPNCDDALHRLLLGPFVVGPFQPPFGHSQQNLVRSCQSHQNESFLFSTPSVIGHLWLLEKNSDKLSLFLSIMNLRVKLKEKNTRNFEIKMISFLSFRSVIIVDVN